LNKDLFRARLLSVAATLTLVGGAAVAFAPAAAAHPEVCGEHEHEGGEHAHEEVCFSQEEIDAMDDSGASLGVDEISHSRNIHHVANLPKTGPFATEGAYNSDLAFTGHHAVVGNYEGFSIVDIANPRHPKLVSTTACPGNQNDVSVAGDLLITSTDAPRNKAECEGNLPVRNTDDSWQGLRVFDISDKAHPRYVTAVETKCGSHTHTTIPDPANGRVIVYVSSYGPNATYPDCQPPHDKISVVEIPTAAPATAKVIAEPVLFGDGGFPGVPGKTSATSGCHDITAYPAKGIAAGACMGQGVLIDITDLANPTVISSVTDPNFAFWHSATFNEAATSVVFTDELGGGGGPTCNPTVGSQRGADAIYRIVDTPTGKALQFASYFKIPRVNHNTENCVAHNGSLIPTPFRDIMVQAWYQGGISVWDFTDPAKPYEIAYFERGPLTLDPAKPILGGSWSAYWYNGHIYSSDIQKGLDVLKVFDPVIAGAAINQVGYANTQTQYPFRFRWRLG
jgi:hypothetical protein